MKIEMGGTLIDYDTPCAKPVAGKIRGGLCDAPQGHDAGQYSYGCLVYPTQQEILQHMGPHYLTVTTGLGLWNQLNKP